MSGNRVDSDSSFLDELFLEDLGDEEEMTEEELIAMVGQGGMSGFHDEPTPGYGGHFSSADGMVAQAVMPEVTDENWRIRGDKVLFDRSASGGNSTTLRLIRPEDVPGAKTRGEFVPISKRNLVAVASKNDGQPRMWIVAEKTEDMFGAAGMVFVRED